MSDARRAVFLSYAREDAAAASRIAEALRSQGVEVWFDQNELRGGDAWDQKIKTQIRECALFLPVVSAHTQERGEGYFRREWKLAVERTHDMAEGVPFLAPVVIDDTPERSAAVPEQFMRVQWTRLPGALPTPQFVEQVKRLLAAPRKPEAGGQRPETGNQRSEDRGQRSELNGQTSYQRRRVVPWIIASVAALAVTIGIYLTPRLLPKAGTTSSARNSVAAQPPLDIATAKSIAVLPFGNLSPDKENEFFADGIHEDVLTNLQNLRALRVVSRTSVLGYRGTMKKVPEIAHELGVAYIVEGSVRRAGDRVRVSVQLIDARTDAHLWSPQPYDRQLTDIFAIQSEIAQAIARAVQAVLSPEEKKLIEKAPTRNVVAYELFLKARHLVHQPNGPTVHRQEIVPLLERAVQLDPTYGAAYADLAYTHVYAGGRPASEVAKAKQAIDTAIRVEPDSPDVIRGLGDYYYYGLGDFARALEQYARMAGLRPNDAQSYHRLGSVQRRQGRWTDAVANFEKARQLDPSDLNSFGALRHTLLSGRRYDEALPLYRLVAGRRPDLLPARFKEHYVAFLATGSTREAEGFLHRLSAAELNSPEGIALRTEWALRHGDLDEAIRLDRESGGGGHPVVAIDLAAALMVRGQAKAAHERVREVEAALRRQLETDETSERDWGRLASVLAILGRKDEALRCARKAVELMPETRDTLFGPVARAQLAFVYAWTGEIDAAITEYTALIRKPWSFMFLHTPDNNVHVMKRDPRYHPLHGDPRFEALLNDPKNNQPLF